MRMPELYLAKTRDNLLYALDQQTFDYIGRFGIDAGFTASVKELNNPAFHRKLMALFNHAFENWDAPDLYYQGTQVRKQFDQFRKDITIQAGYYDAYVDFHNRVSLAAKSLKFGKMNQDERERLFSAVIDVILQKVLTNYTRSDLDNVLAQTLAFTR
jgi:hypothetical protein